MITLARGEPNNLNKNRGRGEETKENKHPKPTIHDRKHQKYKKITQIQVFMPRAYGKSTYLTVHLHTQH